jgi:hypothetical protein
MKECLSTVQRTLEFSSVLAKISASSMVGKIVPFRLVKKAINSHAIITCKVTKNYAKLKTFVLKLSFLYYISYQQRFCFVYPTSFNHFQITTKNLNYQTTFISTPNH